MWPLLATSLVALTVVLERAWFLLREHTARQPRAVERMLAFAARGGFSDAQAVGENSRDHVARVLSRALGHRDVSWSGALLQSAGEDLLRFNRGISVLDTIVTLAPLEGLFGTVTGMIRAFGLLGANELGAPAVITGGIAEALIATAFGLLIAMIALVPLNFLNTRLEQARQEIESAAAHLEIALLRAEKNPASA